MAKKITVDGNSTSFEKQKRTPKNFDSINAGALKLSLQDKVSLVKSLKESIESEVAEKQQQAEYAKSIIDGL